MKKNQVRRFCTLALDVQYEMIPCSGFIEEVLSVDADADADADAGGIVLA